MNIDKSTKKAALALGGACMLFANTLQAQEQPMSFGVKAGASMSWLSGVEKASTVDKDTTTNAPAFSNYFVTGGATFGYVFHENVGMGVELLYAKLGGEVEIKSKADEEAIKAEKDLKAPKSRISSQDLLIPVMLKVFPMGCDPEEGILALDFGVQFTIPFSTKVEDSARGKKEEWKEEPAKEKKASDNFKNMSLGALAGLSYEFPEMGLVLEARYNFGFTNIYKEKLEAAYASKIQKANNQFGTVSVGYNFARLLED